MKEPKQYNVQPEAVRNVITKHWNPLHNCWVVTKREKVTKKLHVKQQA